MEVCNMDFVKTPLYKRKSFTFLVDINCMGIISFFAKFWRLRGCTFSHAQGSLLGYVHCSTSFDIDLARIYRPTNAILVLF